jgi:DNA repair exonuclease SbcCD nuclease subunit
MIKKCYHIADIHIRLYKRHDEYKEQLIKFFDGVKEDMEKNKLTYNEVRIVVVGDVVHSKVTMSPELIDIVSWFFTECTKISPTVLILGNHDFLANNLDRMDALTPILNNLNDPNIHFYRHTDCYLDDNIVWCVYGHMEGSQRPNIDEAKEKYGPDKKYIGLYHDPLVGLKTSIGYEFETGQDISIFDGLDGVMCGDIHKYQKMDYFGVKIIMPSSLIQQDYGETVNNHGYVIWDMETMDTELINIPSEYGFYTFKINSIEDIENGLETLVNL